jgi:hypothetical protein
MFGLQRKKQLPQIYKINNPGIVGKSTLFSARKKY